MAGAMHGVWAAGPETLTYSMPGLVFPKEDFFQAFRQYAVDYIRENVGSMLRQCLWWKKFDDTYVNFVRVDLRPVALSDKSVTAVAMDIQLTNIKPDPFVVDIPMPAPGSFRRLIEPKELAKALSLEPFQHISREIQSLMRKRATNEGKYNRVWVVEDSVYLKSKLGKNPDPKDIHKDNVETMIKFVYTCYLYSICKFFENSPNPPVYNFIAEPRGFFHTQGDSAVVKVKNVGKSVAQFLRDESRKVEKNYSLIAEVLLQVNLVLYYASVLLNLVHGDLHSKNICVKEKEPCTMLVPGTQDRLAFSQKVYLIDFDWACFKSRDRREIFPDTTSQNFLRDKCRTFRQDFLLVNTTLTPLLKLLNKTEIAMERAYLNNLEDVMARYKFINVKHVRFLNELFNLVKDNLLDLYYPPETDRMTQYLEYLGHFLFSIPQEYFRKNKTLWNEYNRLVRYCDVQGFYITTLNGTLSEKPQKRKREPLSAAQVLLAQAFSGLTF
jgi:hypothetical protein